MRGPRVLVVTDDSATRTWLRRVLSATGYRVRESAFHDCALGNIAGREPDLLIVDIDSAAACGSETIRVFRALLPTPILTLSSDEDAAIAALDEGADDYVRKPFGTKELLARTRNAMRRRAREEGKVAHLVTGDLEIDLLCRRITSQGREVHLPARPYEVLKVLVEGAGRVVLHEEILRAVWRSRPSGRMHDLRVAIQELRRKLEPDPAHPRYILTEVGVGYRLECKDAASLPSSASPRPRSPPDGPRR